MRKYLYPLIPKESSPDIDDMKRVVIPFVKDCSIITPEVRDYITDFKKGYNHPEYLFTDSITIENAISNPIAKWKVKLNKRNYK